MRVERVKGGGKGREKVIEREQVCEKEQARESERESEAKSVCVCV